MTFRRRPLRGKDAGKSRGEAVSGKEQQSPAPVAAPLAAPAVDVLDATEGELIGPIGEGIPAHVWTMLQTAGELAAQRLVELLRSPSFKQYSPQAQRGLIELALTRAYGLPIRRAVNLNLSSTDADAVAASLADMAQHLPETSIAAAARSGPENGGNSTGEG